MADNITAYPWAFELPDNAFRRELEGRASIESLEELHQQRRDIIELLAPLDLLFGSGGDRWTATRRQHRDAIANMIATENKWEKPPSEALLERMANGDPRHQKFVSDTDAKYPQYMMLKTSLAEVEERIESRLAEMRHNAAETRMAG